MNQRRKLKHFKGQVDLQRSLALKGNDITSNYGKPAVFEFSAESFADTFTHVRNAKRAGKETVKEYEKLQKEVHSKSKI